MKTLTSATGSKSTVARIVGRQRRPSKKTTRMTTEEFGALLDRCQAWAKETGLTPEDITDAIKEARKELREEREQKEKRECA